MEGYHVRWSRVYKLLRDAGHSPFKALEILVDARGDRHALDWIGAIFAGRHS